MAEIIELFTTADKAREATPITKGPRKPYCAHDKITLDDRNRRAYCRECKDEIDLFDFSMRLCGRWEACIESWKRADREAKAARARLEELKREERNIKARIRAGAKKLDLKRCDSVMRCGALVLANPDEKADDESAEADEESAET